MAGVLLDPFDDVALVADDFDVLAVEDLAVFDLDTLVFVFALDVVFDVAAAFFADVL